MPKLQIFFLVTSGFLLTSCQSPKTSTPPTTEKKSYKTLSTSIESSPQAYPVKPSAGINELVAMAIAHHPLFKLTQERANGLRQSALRARSLPDPQLSVRSGAMAETAAGKILGSAGIQQKIPYPGKRSTQERIFSTQARALAFHLEAQKLILEKEVRITYWDYYETKETSAIIEESKKLLKALKESVNVRIQSGQSPQQDLLRVQNEITRLDQRLTTVKGRGDASRETLNALLYRPSGSSLPRPKDSSPRKFSSKKALMKAAQKNHPTISMAALKIEAARSGVRLAQLSSRPDFTLAMSYSHVSDEGLSPVANGRDQWVGGVSVSIPLWGGKNKATEKKAQSDLNSEKFSLQIIRTSLQERIEKAYALYRAEKKNLALYRKNLIPDAQQSFDLSMSNFQNGSVSFTDIIDTWRQLLNYKIQREKSRSRLGKADASLRSAAGIKSK